MPSRQEDSSLVKLLRFFLQQMAKVLVALLRFSPKQQKELLRKVDEQVNQVSFFSILGHLFVA